jgi:hypothetical protein
VTDVTEWPALHLDWRTRLALPGPVQDVGDLCVQLENGQERVLHRTDGAPSLLVNRRYDIDVRSLSGQIGQVLRVTADVAGSLGILSPVSVYSAGILYGLPIEDSEILQETFKEDIEWLVANKPAGSVVLLDEAYIHLSHSAVRATYLVAQDKDLIILRTFSKLYGMAGIRAGAALGRPDLVEKLRAYGSGPLPVAGMAGATASLKAANVVAERRKVIRDTREDVFGWLDRKNFAFVPSETNCFMIDTKRPGQEVIRALADEKVYIGRVWPVWPTHVRVSVGTREEMAKFKEAFGKVMA